MTAKSGYDANTQEQEEEKELPSTVTVLVRPEQSRLLARLEAGREKSTCHWYTGETARKPHSSLKHRIWCWRSFWKKPQRKKRYLL